MKWYDPITFSFGSRQSIERIARSRCALLVGFLLVVTAGMARNYDHHLFDRDFQWIAGPVIVSLISSLFIFAVSNRILRVPKAEDGSRNYFSFLALFWMTAPIAWIYAVPVERWVDPLSSAKWNVAFLAIVSLWRVVLMSRAISVITGARPKSTVVAVLIPASFEMAIAGVIHFFTALSVAGIMSGMARTEHDQFAEGISTAIFFISVFVLVALLIEVLLSKRSPAPTAYPAPSGSLLHPVVLGAAAIVALGFATAAPDQARLGTSREAISLHRSKDFDELYSFLRGRRAEEFSHIYGVPRSKHMSHSTESEMLSRCEGSEPNWCAKSI